MTGERGRFAGRVLLLMAIVGTIGCDRVTKEIAFATLAHTSGHSFFGDTLRLAYAENTGGFMSLGATLAPAARAAIFTVGTGMTLLILTVMAFRRRMSGWPAFGLALFISGGASNWIDRVMHGAVVDFLNVGIGPLRTGVFNVADVAILLGAGVFVVAELWKGLPRPDEAVS